MISAIGLNRLGSEEASNSGSILKEVKQSTFLVKKEMMLEHIEEASSAKDEFSRTASMLNSQVEEDKDRENYQST